ncbi:MAG: transglycosylase domain-containing protein [Spirochaetales bacterium]|nr:transglycosylase domain-containing protein [Spirochaetales bacterium]
MTRKVLHIAKTALSVIVMLHCSFFIVAFTYIHSYIADNPKTTAIMHFRRNQHGYTLKPPAFMPLNEIPIDMVSALIFIEDYHFFRHSGIDIGSIKRAMEINRRLGYLAYGGSTITQQLSRTLFLNPDKNYFRKYCELLLALEMELILTKERILELYFNYAEWGGNCYGIADAAFFHFHNDVHDLTEEEKVILLTLLANPLDYAPETVVADTMMKARHDAIEVFFEEMKKAPPRFKSQIRVIE